MFIEAIGMKRARKFWSCVPRECPNAALTLSNSKQEPAFGIRVFCYSYSSRDLRMIAQLLCRQSVGVTQLMPHSNSLLPLDQYEILSNARCQLLVWHHNHDSLYLEISNPQLIMCIIWEYVVSPVGCNDVYPDLP